MVAKRRNRVIADPAAPNLEPLHRRSVFRSMRWTLFGLLLATLGVAAIAFESDAARSRTESDGVRASLPGWRLLSEVERHARAAEKGSPAGESPSEDGTTRTGPCSVRLLGADGQPAQGIEVELYFPAHSRRAQERETTSTDRDGRVSFAAPQPGERVLLRSGRRDWTVPHDGATWHASALIPAAFRLLDGQTGRPVRGSLKRSSTPSHVWTQHHFTADLVVLPESGFAPESSPIRGVAGRISHYATGVRISVPVRPEARIRFRVKRHDGRPALNATVAHASMDSSRPELVELSEDDELLIEEIEEEEPEEPCWEDSDGKGIQWDSDASTVDSGGRVTLRGVPFLQGERLRFLLQEGGRHAYVELLLGRRNQPRELDVVLPRGRNTPEWGFNHRRNISIGCGGGGRTRISGRGSAKITIYHADGRPARRALVKVWRSPGREKARTNDHGEIWFRDLPPGTHTAEVLEAGFVYTKQEFEIRGENETLVEIVESEGRTADILVVDDRGDPVPYAELEVAYAPAPYALIRNGIQELLLHTEKRGEAALPGLPLREITIRAKFGTRKASADLPENGGRLIIELPPPE